MIDVQAYQRFFAHETQANHDMLKMLASVPPEAQADDRFQRALRCASHMCLARTVHLKILKGDEAIVDDWFPLDKLEELEAKFDSMEAAWKSYFEAATNQSLEGDFTFPHKGHRYRMDTEAQLFQLIGHAAYHRGQVVLLADQLGGETFNTDYINWFENSFRDRWGRIE